jgi:23S rRNA pseudouridine2604 synthase
MAKSIIGENVVVEKEYLVKVQGDLTEENLRLLNHGLTVDGYKLKPAKVAWQNEDQLKFILTEGRNRQIRKMCAMVNLKVTSLKRVRIGNISLGNLPLGQWRFLRTN